MIRKALRACGVPLHKWRGEYADRWIVQECQRCKAKRENMAELAFLGGEWFPLNDAARTWICRPIGEASH